MMYRNRARAKKIIVSSRPLHLTRHLTPRPRTSTADRIKSTSRSVVALSARFFLCEPGPCVLSMYPCERASVRRRARHQRGAQTRAAQPAPAPIRARSRTKPGNVPRRVAAGHRHTHPRSQRHTGRACGPMPRNAPQRHTRREIARHGAWRRPPHGAAPPIEGGAVHRQKINGRAPRPDSTARSWSNVVQLEHRATAPRLHTGSARSWATRHAPSRVLMMVERNVCHRSKARLGTSNQPIVRRSCEFPSQQAVSPAGSPATGQIIVVGVVENVVGVRTA